MRKPAVNRGCGRPAPESPAVRGFCPRGRKQAALMAGSRPACISLCVFYGFYSTVHAAAGRTSPAAAFFCKKRVENAGIIFRHPFILIEKIFSQVKLL